jgi:uncharacterized protein YecE (DUF72 family)
MQIRVGTSGYSYKPWKGPFYPEDLPDAKMLAFYATMLPTVEINNTFYRMPKRDLLERWAGEVPESFRFVLKASQRITHHKRLRNADEEVGYFFETAAVLGDRLGPVLFQLPPNSRKDVPRLEDFLALVPGSARAALEFRHDSWLDEEVYAALRAAGAAHCLADTDESEAEPALVATADWGYLRLRRSEYSDAELAAWLERIRAQPWREAYVFFKHEDEGRGPDLARRLIDQLG